MPTERELLEDLRTLVTCESPSTDLAAVAASAEVVAHIGLRLTAAEPERIVLDGCTHLRWRFGGGQILLLGHHDTVWPAGSLAGDPWAVRDGRAYGPGCFDMKAGLVQLFHALGSQDDLDGVTVLITGDEELGAPTSRELIEAEARGAGAVLVLEGAAAGGALKTARKGTAQYTVRIHGRAAHAGLEPWSGVNATLELAHQVLALAELGSNDPRGTTVTPTVAAAGITTNTVPAQASVSVDVRAPSRAELVRIESAVKALAPRVAGAQIEVLTGPVRSPLEPSVSAQLFSLAERVAADLNLGPLRHAMVGGASDGNITAGVGAPTLDGLGAVGGGAHAPGEHVVVSELPRRTDLVAGLIRALRVEPIAPPASLPRNRVILP